MPGRVVVPGRGTIDFSRPDVPLEMVRELYENDFPYLDITEEGKEVIYDIKKASPNPSKRGEKEEETPDYFTGTEKIPVMKTEKPKRKRKKKNSANDQG